ncbi:MAG: WD40 repeat domain-containing protein [Saprospiraceae bacterium]|nr:WD40 repeat domain-containing protein [Lewinella sp.]
MRYELAHDSLARQILDRVSVEAKARRQAAQLVERAYRRYLERGILLTREDLDEIRPHEDGISFSPEELDFIKKSRAALERATRRKRQVVITIISALSIFLLFALWQWQRSVASTKALKANAAYETGYPSRAFRLAKSSNRTLGIDKDTKKMINGVLQNISASGLVRDLIHEQPVKTFDINPDETRILSITQGNSAYIWDLENYNILHTIEYPEEIREGAFLPWSDTGAFITLAGQNTAYFRNGDGTLAFQYQLSDPINGFVFSQRSKLVALWSAKEVVLLSDSTNILKLPEMPAGDLIQVDISPNGNYLLLATEKGVRTWWIQYLQQGLPPQQRAVLDGAIKWSGFVASDLSNPVILVQYEDGSITTFDQKGQSGASNDNDNPIFGNPEYSLFNTELKDLDSNLSVVHIDFSQPGYEHPKILFQPDSTTVYYWSAYREYSSGERAGSLDFYTRNDAPIIGTQFSKGDRYLLTASSDGRVDIYDISGSALRRYKRLRAQIRQARFIRQDNWLLGTSFDNTIKIWQLNTTKKTGIQQILNNYDTLLQVYN